MNFGYVHYPLDSQDLVFSFEDIFYVYGEVAILGDNASARASSLSVPGYSISSDLWVDVGENIMATDFGLGDEASVYSHCDIGMTIERSSLFYTMKVLPPAIITLMVSVIVTWLDPMELQGRLGTAVSGLLSMVFLSTGTASKIPDVGQVTVSDWIYNWYFLILLVIVMETIIVHRWLKRFGNVLLFKALQEVGDNPPEKSASGATGAASGTTGAASGTTDATKPVDASAAASAAAPAAKHSFLSKLSISSGGGHKGLNTDQLNENFKKRLVKAKKVDKITTMVIIILSILGTIVISLGGKFGTGN